jgi:redox-sensitive bicupin YhaK (pirin superfamily)
MSNDIILSVKPLGFPWETADPFLFCVYHNDAFPAGNDRLGPAASLAGRNIGMDFEGKDGWRMYHGSVVPGFPQHPHRGFETVTVMRQGYIDHSDSLGATARFGKGDVQWLTAGKGIVHCEMFPLLDSKGPNPVELFQIWLNLPSKDKFVEPYFSMFWDRDVPRYVTKDAAGRTTEVLVVAGAVEGVQPPPPPPNSWAAREEAHVAIWTITMAPGAEWKLPATVAGVNRSLYLFRGSNVDVAGRSIAKGLIAKVRPDADIALVNKSAEEAEFLLLQGRPIGEPVVQYGPFVMNSKAEIQQAFTDYQTTQFGGWPWPSDDPVFPRTQGRYARHANGRVENVG